MHVPGQLPRRRTVRPGRKQSHRLGNAGPPAHDVGAHHRVKPPALQKPIRHKMGAAQPILLFRGKRYKNNGLVPFTGTHHPSCFQQCRHARAIVVGARRIAAAIQGINGARIIMSGHHNHTRMAARALQRSNDVLLVVHHAALVYRKFIDFHEKTAVSHPNKLIKNPAPGSPNAQPLLIRYAVRIARVKPLQRLDIPHQILPRHLLQQRSQIWVSRLDYIALGICDKRPRLGNAGKRRTTRRGGNRQLLRPLQ